MKNLFKNSLFVLVVFLMLTSCEKETIAPENQTIEESLIVYDHVGSLKKDFAQALVGAMNESVALRAFLKQEALKMFNRDYEILYHLVKDEMLSDGLTVKELLTKHFENDSRLLELESTIPLLTILVPDLPENSFSAKIWEPEQQIPEVAIQLMNSNQVPVINVKGEEYLWDNTHIPGFPILVIRENERIVVDNGENMKSLGVTGAKIKTKDGLIFQFLDDTFNGTNNEKQEKRVTFKLDQTVIDAYNIYKNADGWQRDYIYYNLTPTNTKDQFSYDFQEHVTMFRMNGDAQNAYQKISDQSGDPTYYNQRPSGNSTGWTGGFYEFKVRVLLNAKNGIGSEIITYFSLRPEELFELTYREIKIGPLLYIYMFESIDHKTALLNLPIFNWDLNQYASSVKVEIEEVDLTITTTITDTRSVKFANNFNIDPTDGILKKIGLKFGSTLETNTSQTIQRTFTQGNDALGSLIINFADDVVIRENVILGITFHYTREYSTGWYLLSFEPIRVQGP